MVEGEECIGTMLNKRRYVQLIEAGDKTCEIKSKLVKINSRCKYLVFHGSQEVRDGPQGCQYNIVAKLIDHTPLGPFYSGIEVLRASVEPGREFKVGMGEAELNAFINGYKSQCVYVYRFQDAVVSHDVVWDDREGNNNSGFLPAFNKTRGCVRFTVGRDPYDGMEKKRRMTAWRPPPPLPKIPRIQGRERGDASVRKPFPLPTFYDLLSSSEEEEEVRQRESETYQTGVMLTLEEPRSGGGGRRRSDGGSARSIVGLIVDQRSGMWSASMVQRSGGGKLARAASRQCWPGVA
jgi:hypothetical protein